MEVESKMLPIALMMKTASVKDLAQVTEMMTMKLMEVEMMITIHTILVLKLQPGHHG